MRKNEKLTSQEQEIARAVYIAKLWEARRARWNTWKREQALKVSK